MLDDAEAQHENDPRVWLQRVRYLLDVGDGEQARKALTRVLAMGGEDPDVLLTAARVAMVDKNWNDAVAYGEQALALAPDNAQTYLALVVAYQRLDTVDKAIALLDGIDPLVKANHPDLFLSHVELLLLTGRYEEAETVLDEYRKTYPEHYILFQYLEARELLAKGDAGQAARKLTTVVETNPNFSQAQYFLALAYLQTQQRERARIALDKFLHNNPNSDSGRSLMEQAFGKGQSPAERSEEAQAVLESADASPGALISAATRLWRSMSNPSSSKKHRQTVVALAEKAITSDPSYLPAYQLLADTYIAAGKTADARAVLSRAQSAGLDPAALARTEAAVALAEDNVDAAKALFDKAWSESDMTMNDLTRWANLFASRGQREAGLSVLATAAAEAAPAERITLVLDQIALCARFEDFARAAALLEEAQGLLGDDESARRALNDQKEMLVRALINTGIDRDADEAKRLVDDLRRDEPDNTAFLLLQAQVLARQNPPDYAGARAVVQPLLEINPSDFAALTTLGEIAIREGDLMEALDCAERAAAGSPGDLTSQLFLAQVQIRAKRYLEAQGTLEQVLVTHGETTSAMEMLVETYIATNRLQQAETTLARLERALSASPEESARLALLRSRLLIARGENTPQVEQALRERYVQNPDDFDILRELSISVARQGRMAEAELLLKGFAENHPDQPEPWVTLGQFYMGSKDRASQMKASSAYTRALLTHENYSPALRGLIDLNVRLRRWPEALALCERYLRAQPRDPDVLFRRAWLLSQERKDSQEALRTITDAISVVERPEFLYLRGSLLLAQNKPTDALADLQRVEAGRNVPAAELHAALAEAYLGTGDLELARQYYESALEKNGDGALTGTGRLDRLGDLLKEAGAL